jgi:hypothetical protein
MSKILAQLFSCPTVITHITGTTQTASNILLVSSSCDSYVIHSRKYVFRTLLFYVPKICFVRFVDNCGLNRSLIWQLKLFFLWSFSLYKFWLNLTREDYGAVRKKNRSADDRRCHSVPHQHRNRRHVSNTSCPGTHSIAGDVMENSGESSQSFMVIRPVTAFAVLYRSK